MSENFESGKIMDISPLVPVKMVIEVDNNGIKELAATILFIDQEEGQIFDSKGLIPEESQKAIFTWMRKQQEEMKKMLMQCTPEQLKQMGIDINQTDNQKPNLIL